RDRRRARGYAHPVGVARCRRPDGHEVRLRDGAVRGLHGAPRRPANALVRHAGRRGGGQKDHHDRGHRRHAGRQESTAGLARPRGRAVRLLPVGPYHVGGGAAREERASEQRRHRRRDVGQYLPLRDLPSGPRRDPARREGSLTMTTHAVSRRDFVTVLATAGGGLLLGWRAGEPSRAAMTAASAGAPAFVPNAFIRIGSDSRVTMIMNQVEMGQGTYTSMPMLLAEELEVGLDQVQLEHAPPNDTLYANPLFGDQETGGSSSVRSFYEPLRRAGATARTMLVAAAAQTWEVDPASCRAKRGVVTHGPTGRTLTYGALAEKAATLPVPDTIALKDPKDFTLIGTPAKRLDAAEKVNGKAQYGIDVRLPGMKIATVAASPVLGGKVAALDEAKAMAIPGSRRSSTWATWSPWWPITCGRRSRASPHS